MSDVSALKVEVVFLAKIGEDIKKSLADGKFDVSDALNFTDLLLLIGPAVSDLSQVPAELKTLDVESGVELVGDALAQIPDLSGKAVNVVKEALNMVVAGVRLVEALKS